MAQSAHPAPQTRRRLIIALLVVTILAALLMVAAAVLIWKNGADNGVVLKDNVVIYEEGSSPFTILASDADSVTVSSLDGIDAGAVLAAGVTEATPYGLLRKAVSCEPVEGGYRIATEQAALTEAIEQCDISVSVSYAEDGSYALAYDAPAPSSPFVEQAFADDALNKEWKLFEKKVGPAEVSATFGIDIDLSCNDQDGILFRLVGRFQADASVDDILNIKERLFSKDFTPVEFMVGPLPVVVVPSLAVDATLSGNLEAALPVGDLTVETADFKMSAKLVRELGFEYSTNNGVRSICEDKSECDEVATVLAAQMDFEVSLAFSCLVYNVAGPELSAGVAVNLTANLREVAEGEAIEDAFDLFGSGRRYAGGYAYKVYLPISGKMVLEVPTNIFDLLDPGRIEVALFDTDDAITLVDVKKESKPAPELPFAAAAPRYATCEELSKAVADIFQQAGEGYDDPSVLVATRTASLELFPSEALDIMMDAADVKSVEALGALLSGFSAEDGVSPQDAAALEGLTLLFSASPGDDCSEEDLASLNEELHECGFSGTATAMKEIDVRITAKPTTAETAGREQTQTISKESAIEVDGGWYLSPEAQLADVVEGARAVAATELTTFTTGRRDGAPRLTFEYPTEWESNSSVYGADEPGPLGCCSEIAWASGGPVDASVCLYYFGDELLLADEQATVVKIRDASFDPSAVGSQGTTDGGPYMVAEVVFRDPMKDNVASALTLLPSSFAGEHPLSYLQEGFTLPFRCAGQTVDFGASRGASRFVTTFEDRQMVSKILGSMVVAP